MPLEPRILSFAPGRVFVETGTFDGHGIDLALAAGFERVFSVELDRRLYEAACIRYASDARVKLYYGNSPDVLPEMLSAAGGPATIWLDAHSGISTPLPDELEAILATGFSGHSILIDDVDLFGKPWAMVTLANIKSRLRAINPDYWFFYAGLNGMNVLGALP